MSEDHAFDMALNKVGSDKKIITIIITYNKIIIKTRARICRWKWWFICNSCSNTNSSVKSRCSENATKKQEVITSSFHLRECQMLSCALIIAFSCVKRVSGQIDPSLMMQSLSLCLVINMKQANGSCLQSMWSQIHDSYSSKGSSVGSYVAAETRAKWRNKEKTIPSVKVMMDAIQTWEQNLKC